MSSAKQCDACGLINVIDAHYCARCGSSVFTVGGAGPASGGPAYPSATEGARADWYAARPPDPPVIAGPAPVMPPYAHFQCPYCRSTAPPRVEKRLGNTGIIVMIAMAVFCLPLFWIGFFIKDDVRICGSCGMTLGQ